MRDTYVCRPTGAYGSIVEVRVFNRDGVDKDERGLQIEREEVERLARDRDDELAILKRNIYSRLKTLMMGKTADTGTLGITTGYPTHDVLLGSLSHRPASPLCMRHVPAW